MAADLVVDHRVQDHPVDRQCAGVVGNQQRRTVSGKVLRPSDLDPEPGVSEPPQRRQIDLGGELGVESELIDCIVAAQSLTEEGTVSSSESSQSTPSVSANEANVCSGSAANPPSCVIGTDLRPASDREAKSNQLAEQSAKRWGRRNFLGLETRLDHRVGLLGPPQVRRLPARRAAGRGCRTG